jgi:hypothetical protein
MLGRQRPRDGDVLRAAVVGLEVGSAIHSRGIDVLLLERGWGSVRFTHGNPLLRSRIVPNPARPANIGNTIVDDRRVVHDGLVHIGVVDDGSVHVDYSGVVREIMTAPLAADKSDTHVTEAVVDAAVVADVRTPVSGVVDI